MNKILNLTLGALLGVGLVGCMDDTLPTQSNPKDNIVVDTRVGIEEALERAENMLAELEGPTRSGIRKVESVEVVTGAGHTRSGSADSLLYVVNYSDNAGFALLGTDQRMEEVYAISPTGHLNLNDTVKDEMFSMFINSAIQDAQNSIDTASVHTTGGYFELQKYVSYKNKEVNAVNIPDYIANLFAGPDFDETTKMVNVSQTAVNLCKVMFILYTYYRSNAVDTEWDCFHRSLEDRYDWGTVTAMVQYQQRRLDASNNIPQCLLDMNIYIPGYGRDSDSDGLTGCNCTSYWGLRANVHVNQILNLLKGIGPQSQGMFVTGREDMTDKNVLSFVLDRLMRRDKYIYQKFTNVLLEGPIPEVWMHCLWANIGNSNGYFLYNRDQDRLNVSINGNDSSLQTLFVFGGLKQDEAAGLH